MKINKVILNTQNNLAVEENLSIIYYDGNCGLCRKVKTWIIGQDKKKIFVHKNLRELSYPFYFQNNKLDSIILLEKKSYYIKSNAVIKILIGLEKKNLAFLLNLIPPDLRDKVYDLIAKYRYFFFKETCSLPDKK